MCWNAPVSMISFVSGILACLVIAGSCVSHFSARKPLFILSIGWIWVMIMQLLEFFIWKNPDSPATRWAFVFNVLQIPVLGLLFLAFLPSSSLLSTSIAVGTLLVYLMSLLYLFPSETTVSQDQGHLRYGWWEKTSFLSVLYVISLTVLFVCLVRPLSWSVAVLITILLFLTMSQLFYPQAIASMWCFFAVSIPVFAWLWWKILVDLKTQTKNTK